MWKLSSLLEKLEQSQESYYSSCLGEWIIKLDVLSMKSYFDSNME